MFTHTRSRHYKHCALVIAGLFLAVLLHANKRPNILWITIEDTSPHFIGCYGNAHAKTPAIDSLASKGMRFNRAFATGAVCSSSRSTIITGVYTEQLGTGHHRSRYSIPAEIKGFPAYLRDAGYYTTNNSKTDYNIENEKDFSQLAWNENGNNAGWKNRKEGQAFFSVFNFMESHQSRTMTNPWSWYEKNVLNELDDQSIVNDSSFEMPPFYLDSPEMRRNVSRVYNSLSLTDKRINVLLQELENDGLAENTIIFFYADHGQGIPYGKCNPIAFGYRVPFIVYVPEAYRYLLPQEPGSTTNELISFIDLAPTILSLAGASIPKYMPGRIFMGAEKQAQPEHVFASRNRIDESADLARSISDGNYIYTRVFMPHLPVLKYQKYADVSDIVKQIRADYSEGVLNNSQKNPLEARPLEYLFNIENDPWELNNLANKKEYKHIKNKMREALENQLFSNGDIHFLPESIMLERTKNSNSYDIRFNQQLNPINDLYNAASLVGMADEHVNLIKLMKHPDEAVRYWAALGLKVANNSKLKEKQLLKLLKTETSEPALIELATLSYLRYKNPKAYIILEQAAMSDNLAISTQALQSIIYMGNPASDFVDIAKNVLEINKQRKGNLKYETDCSAEMLLYLYANQKLEY